MARRTHVIGYRLGTGVWWKDRVPPQQQRERGVEKLVRGIMERYGYLTSEVLVQKGLGKGAISLVGAKGGRIEMYLMEYIRELLKKSQKTEYRISYREEEKLERNGELKYREIAKSPQTIQATIRQKKWK